MFRQKLPSSRIPEPSLADSIDVVTKAVLIIITTAVINENIVLIVINKYQCQSKYECYYYLFIIIMTIVYRQKILINVNFLLVVIDVTPPHMSSSHELLTKDSEGPKHEGIDRGRLDRPTNGDALYGAIRTRDRHAG